MKITKRMGYAALRELETGEVTTLGTEALDMLAGEIYPWSFMSDAEEETALAFIMAIAGVKP
jgi:hypothetical protein